VATWALICSGDARICLYEHDCVRRVHARDSPMNHLDLSRINSTNVPSPLTDDFYNLAGCALIVSIMPVDWGNEDG